MTGLGGRNKKRTRNYVCKNHLAKNGKTCTTKSINAEYLETAIKEILIVKINEYLASANAETIFGLLKKQKSDEAIKLKKQIQRTQK